MVEATPCSSRCRGERFAAGARGADQGTANTPRDLAGRAGQPLRDALDLPSDLERGRQTPTLDLLNRVARGLAVTLADFFAPLDEPYRARFRKPRRDVPRRPTHR